MRVSGAATRRPFLFDPADPRGRRRARWAAVVWGLFLLALTSWPSPPEVPVVSAIPNFDKLVHAILYGVEGFLLCRAVGWPPGATSPWLRALAIGGVLAVWGTLDEIHQFWIPGRFMEAMDALTDATAGFSGALAASFASRAPFLRRV
jgi:VanZ family protein